MIRLAFRFGILVCLAGGPLWLADTHERQWGTILLGCGLFVVLLLIGALGTQADPPGRWTVRLGVLGAAVIGGLDIVSLVSLSTNWVRGGELYILGSGLGLALIGAFLRTWIRLERVGYEPGFHV